VTGFPATVSVSSGHLFKFGDAWTSTTCCSRWGI